MEREASRLLEQVIVMFNLLQLPVGSFGVHFFAFLKFEIVVFLYNFWFILCKNDLSRDAVDGNVISNYFGIKLIVQVVFQAEMTQIRNIAAFLSFISH